MELSKAALERILDAPDLSAVSVVQLVEFFRNEAEAQRFLPERICERDPRTGEHVLYSTARGRRPRGGAAGPEPQAGKGADSAGECIVCEGKLTRVVDCAELSRGFTFINKNLFPILFPWAGPELLMRSSGEGAGQSSAAFGLHFLQWTSSVHGMDWQNMPVEDGVIVLKRLAALEKKLLFESGDFMPANQEAEKSGAAAARGYVTMMKNYGRLVGGSVVHGHQQIAWSNLIPGKVLRNAQFREQRGECFSGFLWRENPGELLVCEYPRARLMVPHFMRRPYELMLLMSDTEKQWLHQLDEEELLSVALGWRDGIRVVLRSMEWLGREPAYNVTSNAGPGAGIYFDFVPHTQEYGGFEQMGLWVCQETPKRAAERARRFLEEGE